jgi:hypothetical protein
MFVFSFPFFGRGGGGYFFGFTILFSDLGHGMQLMGYDRYGQLASPLVKQGVWADSDDYQLVEE